MTDKEKAREICGCEWHKQQGDCSGVRGCYDCSIDNEYYSAMAMAEWKENDLFQWIRENLNKYVSVGNTDFGRLWLVDWDKMMNDYKKHNEQE